MTIGSAIGREIDLDQLVRGVAAILPNAILYLWTGSLVWFEGALVTMSLLIVLTRAGPSLGLLLLFVHLLALWPISLVSVALVMRPPLAPNAGGRSGGVALELAARACCGRSSRGVSQLKRQTRRDRMRARLRAIKEELQRRMHEPIPLQGKWLRQVVRGYFAYHAVPTNYQTLSTFRHYVMDLWRRAPVPKSKRQIDMGTDSSTCKRVLAFTPTPSSLAERTLRRQIPKVGARELRRRDLCGGAQ
jgi:hypothetical protein